MKKKIMHYGYDPAFSCNLSPQTDTISKVTCSDCLSLLGRTNDLWVQHKVRLNLINQEADKKKNHERPGPGNQKTDASS